MVRSGKERAAPSPLRGAHVAGADDATIQDTRFLQGINRQLRPDAPSHQLAASRAAAAKRKATAMAGEEKAAADRARADRRKPRHSTPEAINHLPVLATATADCHCVYCYTAYWLQARRLEVELCTRVNSSK